MMKIQHFFLNKLLFKNAKLEGELKLKLNWN